MHVRVKSAFGRYRCRLSAIGSQRGPLPLSTFVQSMRNDIRLQSRNPALPVGTKRRPTPAKHQRRWGRLRKERTGIKCLLQRPHSTAKSASFCARIHLFSYSLHSFSIAGGRCLALRIRTHSLSSQTPIHEDLNFHAPVFGSALRCLVGSCGISCSHRSRRHDVPNGDVAVLDQVGNDFLGTRHAQLLVHGGIARRVGKALHGNDVAVVPTASCASFESAALSFGEMSFRLRR